MMKMACTGSKFIFAVIVFLALFIALPGTGVPSCAKASKKGFSPRAVVETQAIETDGSVSKTGKLVAALHCPFFSFEPADFYVASFVYEARYWPSSVSTLIPARASPSIN
jgi:hypothetical protein